MIEIWKDIKDYKGLYQVSNLGNIKRVGRKILKLKKDKRNYLRVILSKNGKTKTFLVHRLVAQAFIKNPFNKPYINHKNENPSDNNINNLEWATNSENLLYNNCLKKGKRLKQGKPIIQFDKNMNKINEYGSMAEASEITNISSCNIRNSCKGRSKTAGGYIWKYKN